ncbi:hypothetical protein SAMN00790413_04504 [Deinococcus hopiensis KR-140]|uniref:Uncharacterized protein n=1 Tax=Deinococcus hopiensis KR-140 TaxID=695939 RepID=A0A1W1UJM8_9DEIO|nr:hypothetical protein SAMN00790413_04504 [Deinococcus hopiensis KR-140]
MEMTRLELQKVPCAWVERVSGTSAVRRGQSCTSPKDLYGLRLQQVGEVKDGFLTPFVIQVVAMRIVRATSVWPRRSKPARKR